jgi:hypothetical protein
MRNRIGGPGWEKFESEMEKIGIRDKHPGSATLVKPPFRTVPIRLNWLE